jgi:hypothetical protein
LRQVLGFDRVERVDVERFDITFLFGEKGLLVFLIQLLSFVVHVLVWILHIFRAKKLL